MTAKAAQSSGHDGSGAMFDGIAKRYDLLNRLMSFGLDRRWRANAVDALRIANGHRVLDLATGTADLAIEIANRNPTIEVVGLDPSTKMLEVGRDKIGDRNITLTVGDATKLEYDDDSFDGVTIAFGIRNFPDRAAALREISRVLRPGGRLAILELNDPEEGFLAPFAKFFIRKVVPLMGRLLSTGGSYQYLESSIAAFPPPAEFAGLIERCGFATVTTKPQTFGVATLYCAEVSG